MKRTLNILGVASALAVVLSLGLAAQSTRVGGRDVPVTPFEQWFQRLGLLNTNRGCDVAVEADSLGVARVTDCTDSANVRDLKVRNLFGSTGLFSSGNFMLGGAAAGAAGSENYITKTITGVTDATYTDLVTVTVPNAAHGASIPLVLHGILGAGGAVGAGECSATAYGQVVLARTAGLATVATATTLSNTGSACVAGATTIALAYQVTSMTGANSATQTFTIQGRVTKGAGSSANHVILVSASALNWAGSGVTIQ